MDVTKIQTISFVYVGRQIDGKLNIDWGQFGGFVPPLPADGSNPNITFAPNNSQGNRVDPTAFSSNNPNNGDYSNSSVTMLSPTFFQVDMNLYNSNSYGGFFLNYDNPNTGTAQNPVIETINLSTEFPNGIVLGLDNGGTGLTKVKFEVTDANGRVDEVYLIEIEPTGKRWKILTSQFDEVDITKIVSIAVVGEGQLIGKRLNVDWGLFGFTPTVNSDPSNPATTTVPANYAGNRPELIGFSSNNPGAGDYSNANAVATSATAGHVDMNLYNTTSFGGAFISYDNPATGTQQNPVIETINLSTSFPNGIVLGLSSSTITEIFLDATDDQGRRYSIRLNGISSTEKRFKILTSLFDSALIDITKIQSLALVVKGQHVGESFTYNWGKFAFVPSFSPDVNNPNITPLPVTSTGALVELTSFASQNASVQADITSQTNAHLTFNLPNTNSFGGVFVNYDDPTTGTAQNPVIETINLNTAFSNGMVLELSNLGTALSSIYLEVTDINGKKDRVRLADIVSQAKRWNIPISAFDEIDTTKVQSIALVLDGGPATNLELDINWGNWQAPI